MNKFVNAMKSHDSFTQNGAVAHSSSGNELIDFFFAAGAGRGGDVNSLYVLFKRAFLEHPLDALRTLFWVRDVRGGAGERQVFRALALRASADKDVFASLAKNMSLIPEYGRWDDLFVFVGTVFEDAVVSLVAKALEDKNGLCAKWMPRRGAVAEFFRRALGLSARDYRKKIVELSKTVEQNMSAKKWDSITYSAVPSVTMKKYTEAFNRHDHKRFADFKAKLVKGETKINASAIFPHDVLKNRDAEICQAQWDALPNFMEGSETRGILPLVDVSGSMCSSVDGYTTALDIAVALGLYVADKNKGEFKDLIMTFTDAPSFVDLRGFSDIKKKMKAVLDAPWGMSTNLEAAFNLILKKAVQHSVPQSDLPSTLLIMSDMQFNSCVYSSGSTVYEAAKREFETAGYTLPNVIFWNIAGRTTQNLNGKTYPVKFADNGTALISGYSPSILKSLMSGSINPVDVFKKTVTDNPRYSSVTL